MELDWMNDPEEAEVLANEYADGFFAGSYRVKETVELNGIRIPSLIAVRRVLPLKPARAGPQSEWVWTVTVDSFGSEELDSYQPQIPEGYEIYL